jgi:acetyl-CoA/propionyl-CoA/long-chain acyl-CoA carboxylase, biotin carboxylase, biotin carboxyl carrier protein
MPPPFDTVLIANRGEIAVRVIRACRALGIRAAVVHSTPDAGALHVRMADVAVALDGSTPAATYLDGPAVIDAAKRVSADAVHPGYGFLAENAAFAADVLAADLQWIGPPPDAIRSMGDKITARATAERVGVHGVPGTRFATVAVEEVADFAEAHGFPIVIKASAGGGGRGMRVVRAAAEIEAAVEAARREALASFGNGDVYVEKYLEWPRHVEVQVFADQHGNCVAVGERDCSVQRRHQKLIEEAPAPDLSRELRIELADAAVKVAREVGYVGAGTVEFLVENGRCYFLEMNTRLQVEHPVTEAVFGVDLVVEQLRVATGAKLSFAAETLAARGHAIECRINAEDPAGGRFIPQSGKITQLDVPHGPGLRFDTGFEVGDEISPHYDSLIGKLIAWGADRDAALRTMVGALRDLRVGGIPTTAQAQGAILEHPDFVEVRHATQWLETDVIQLPDVVEPSEAQDTPDGEEEVWVNGRRYWLGPPPPASTGALSLTRETARPASGRRSPGPRPNKAPSPGSDGVIRAPMQGTVISVAAKPGAAVDHGEVLLVMEAMKMESQIIAVREGTIAEVRVTPGESVASGAVLVVLD